MFSYEDATTLSLLYHLNSEPWLNVEAYTDPAAEVRFQDHSSAAGGAVALPPVDGAALLALLGRRRSCRAYEPRPLPAATIARLLAGAYGGM